MKLMYWNYSFWNNSLLVHIYAIHRDMKYTMKTLSLKSKIKKKYSGKKEGDKLNVPIWILFAQNFHFEKKCTKEDVKVKYHCLRISISYMKHYDMPFRLIYLKHTIKLQEECISKSNERCANLNLIWNLICFMRSVISSYSSNWHF